MTDPIDDTRLRYEALYELAKTAWERESDRYEAAEEKADRYVTIALALLGAGGFAVPHVLRLLSGRSLVVASYVELLMALFFVAAFVLLLVAAIKGLAALRPGKVRALPIDVLPKHFRSQRYDSAILSMSYAFVDAAILNRQAVQEKFAAIRTCHATLLAGLACGLCGSALFSFLST